MDKILEFANEPKCILIIILLLFVCFVIAILNIIKMNKLIKKYNRFISKFSKGINIETILENYARDVDSVKKENKDIKKEISSIERNVANCIQRVGIVRYNAFSDTGSDLCFALALLDFENNGVVINGVYSRDNTTTTYAKPVKNGISKYTLSKEEQEAIQKAKQMNDSYYIEVK